MLLPLAAAWSRRRAGPALARAAAGWGLAERAGASREVQQRLLSWPAGPSARTTPPVLAAAAATTRPAPLPRPWHVGPGACSLHTGPHQQGEQEKPGDAPSQHPCHLRLDPPPPWLARALAPAAWPYAALARLDKPAGTALLLWPGLWSIAAAAPPGSLPDARLTALFTVGALLLRGAGCTVNDLWDRELDARVARTAGRPLACGAVTVPGAVAFLAAQLAAGAAVLAQFDGPTIALGCASLPLVAGYPLAKRFLPWPQAVLGLTFNWGALLGWVAALGAGVADPALVAGGGGTAGLATALTASLTPASFYAGGAAWTQWYDTVYAFQDKADDEKAGVLSSARTLSGWAPGREKVALAGFAAGAGVLLAVGGAAAGLGAPFYWCLALAGGLGAAQLARLDLADPAACGVAFRAHAGLGGLVWGGIVAGRVMS